MKNNIKISVVNGVSKKTNQPYEAVQVEIGDWKGFISFKSYFEKQYVIETIKAIENGK